MAPSLPQRLRRAAAADLPEVAEVYLRAREAAYPAMPRGIHPPHEVRGWVAGWDLSACEVWVADDGGVVGFARFDRSCLHDLYVDPAAQGRGIGAALLDLVKTRRPDGFSLWVFESNSSARGFYRARGLTEVERTDGADNEEQAPDVRMVWGDVAGQSDVGGR